MLSDFLAPGGWTAALDVLRTARFEPALLQVSSPDEGEAPVRGEVLLEPTGDHEAGPPALHGSQEASAWPLAQRWTSIRPSRSSQR